MMNVCLSVLLPLIAVTAFSGLASAAPYEAINKFFEGPGHSLGRRVQFSQDSAGNVYLAGVTYGMDVSANYLMDVSNDKILWSIEKDVAEAVYYEPSSNTLLSITGFSNGILLPGSLEYWYPLNGIESDGSDMKELVSMTARDLDSLVFDPMEITYC